MTLGPVAPPATASISQLFGPVAPNVPGYFAQPEMYAHGTEWAYWLPSPGSALVEHFHNGVDWTGARGIALMAPETAMVVHTGIRYVPATGQPDGGGLVVGLQIRPGTILYLAHNDAILVAKNRIVAKGTPVARLGQTGIVTGPVCHETLEIRETSGGVTRTKLWNARLFMAGGKYANDARIKPAYGPPGAEVPAVAFNAAVNGVNLRDKPDARPGKSKVLLVAYRDPKGIVRLSDGKKVGNTSSPRRLYAQVIGTDGLPYNQLKIAGSGVTSFVQSRFMHRVK